MEEIEDFAAKWAKETREELQGIVDPICDKIRRRQVSEREARELMAKPNVDGALVGGASLKADGFAAIVKGAI
jgi:hypothetical protein